MEINKKKNLKRKKQQKINILLPSNNLLKACLCKILLCAYGQEEPIQLLLPETMLQRESQMYLVEKKENVRYPN